MNLTPREKEQLKLALARIAEHNRTLINSIDKTLKGMQAAQETLEAMRQDSLIASSAIEKMTAGQNVLDDNSAVKAAPDGSSEDSAESKAGEPVSAVSRIEDFLDFAIAIISAWQGNSWGVINPDPLEYGLFGFKGKRLQQVLDNYFDRTSKVPSNQLLSLSWYAVKANDQHMRAAQLHIARDFLQTVMRLSIEPRGIRSPLGKLMIMDAAVDHGLTHEILKRTEVDLGLDVIKADGRYIKPYLPALFNDEVLYFQHFALERMKEHEAQRADLSQQIQERLRERYEWFEKLAFERDMTFEKQADGVVDLGAINITVPLPEELLHVRGEPQTMPSRQKAGARQLAYGSPVDPAARAVLPWGWCSAIDHGEIYQHTKFKGQMHTGLDINRCDDVDEGLPVYSVADGLIVFAGVGAGSWGNLVVIRHPDGVWSRYGHLKNIAASIRKGENCNRGALLGTIGRGHKEQFNAHLHFDMCKTSLWQANPSWWSANNPAEIKRNYVDPVEFISERGWWML
ncbi:MAG: peptidoglycan DD-metalloendopeptidase family protein [Chloroflexi bacterium]|nr:peptidoglycan DD-metalloendopeptidase family protein [Chloroflexota bacterium]